MTRKTSNRKLVHPNKIRKAIKQASRQARDLGNVGELRMDFRRIGSLLHCPLMWWVQGRSTP